MCRIAALKKQDSKKCNENAINLTNSAASDNKISYCKVTDKSEGNYMDLCELCLLLEMWSKIWV